jgi:formate dehydrogenase major subunit
MDRRTFLKGAMGVSGAAVALGFDLSKARAEMRNFKISRTTETRSICPYCSVSCGVIIHTLGDRAKNVTPAVVHVEGDPDHPINQGALCPKGATLKHDIVNDRRITRPMYRAPGSDQWEEKSWDFMIDRIARLVKDTRDAKLREGNALTAVGAIGGCTDNNENNYLIVKAFRAGLGMIPLEQQARI